MHANCRLQDTSDLNGGLGPTTIWCPFRERTECALSVHCYNRGCSRPTILLELFTKEDLWLHPISLC